VLIVWIIGFYSRSTRRAAANEVVGFLGMSCLVLTARLRAACMNLM
jgi:hypothetical protein